MHAHVMHAQNLARRAAAVATLALLGLGPASTAAEPAAVPSKEGAGWSLVRHPGPAEAAPTVPLKATSVDLVLDDGGREVDVGFTGAVAFQFLWFNRLAPPAPGRTFDLEEIRVLFPPGPEVVPGAAVELVVFTDPDGDPTNGADLVASFDDVVQVADGTTFSVYPVDPPLRVSGSGDVLVGVVNRFVVSGVSPPSRPAALDTSTSAGRSWVALWTGDPPSPPSLPSDDVLQVIDVIEPGNWLIRVSGTVLFPIDVPVLDGAGLAMLAALLALAAVVVLRKVREPLT